MTHIQAGDWVVLRSAVENPHIYSSVAQLVVKSEWGADSYICRIKNPLDDSESVLSEKDLVKVKGITLDEYEVLEALKTASSDVYEPVFFYINQLRKQLGMDELDFPWVRMSELR